MIFRKAKIRKEIDSRILELSQELETEEPGTDYYTTIIRQIEDLKKIRANDNSVSPDTVLVVVGNLAGILLILNFEKAGIITSRAINFVMKGRV